MYFLRTTTSGVKTASNAFIREIAVRAGSDEFSRR
jgi:hypothetical protein